MSPITVPGDFLVGSLSRVELVTLGRSFGGRGVSERFFAKAAE
jgi:hypothetical protein